MRGASGARRCAVRPTRTPARGHGDPNRRPQRTDDDDQRRDARPHCGEDARCDTEDLAALREFGSGDGHLRGREQHHTRGEPAQRDEPRADPVAPLLAGEEVDRTECEPRHVEHGAREKEQAEDGRAPAMRLCPPQRHSAGREQAEGNGPRKLVVTPPPLPAVERAETERQCNEGRCRSERGVQGHAVKVARAGDGLHHGSQPREPGALCERVHNCIAWGVHAG